MSVEKRHQEQLRATPLGLGPRRLFLWLQRHRLPVTVERLEGVNALRALLAAGFVKAQIPEPVRKWGRTEQPPAVVTALTSRGRKWHAQLLKEPRNYGRIANTGTTPDRAPEKLKMGGSRR